MHIAIYLIDPQTNRVTWLTYSPMPSERRYLCAATDHQGIVYAIGGYDGTVLDLVEAYNPLTDTWSTVAPMGTPRMMAAAATGPDGRIYVVGGNEDNGTGYLASMEVYDPLTDTWSDLASMGVARQGLVAVFGQDNQLYCIGGYNNIDLHLQTNESYDLYSNTWTTKDNLPLARAYMAAGLAETGVIHVFGGTGNSGLNYSGNNQVYIPSLDAWSAQVAMPVERRNHGCAVTSDGRMYLIGGYNTETLGSVEKYTPGVDTWSDVADIPTPRQQLAVAVSDDRIFVLGGQSVGDSFSTKNEGTPVLVTKYRDLTPWLETYSTINITHSVSTPHDTASFALLMDPGPAPTYITERAEVILVDLDSNGHVWGPATQEQQEVLGTTTTWGSGAVWGGTTDRVLFGGFIARIKSRTITAQPLWDITLQDYSAGLQQLFTARYQNMYDGDILRDILSNQTVGGWTTTNIKNNVLVQDLTFIGEYAIDAIQKIVGLGGWHFQIDQYRGAWYQAPTDNRSAIGFSTEPDDITMMRIHGWDYDRDGTRLTRRVLVQGGTWKAPAQEEINATGSQVTFFSAEKPYPIEAEVWNGSAYIRKTIGMAPVQDGYECIVDQESKSWSFVTAVTTKVRLTYTYDVQAQEQVAATPVSGFYWDQKISDSAITGPEAAGQRAVAELLANLNGARTLKIVVGNSYHLTPGMVVPIRHSIDRVDADFLIQQMAMIPLGIAPGSIGPDGYAVGKYGWELTLGAFQHTASSLLAAQQMKAQEMSSEAPPPGITSISASISINGIVGGVDGEMSGPYTIEEFGPYVPYWGNGKSHWGAGLWEEE